jgi:hypothetical protein
MGVRSREGTGTTEKPKGSYVQVHEGTIWSLRARTWSKVCEVLDPVSFLGKKT